ncbi:MAG: hypothetical protein E6356_14155 [Terrisporobacter othiniensis]|nr:hypothetical protein [Terrisporobacter othiniensis]
MYISRSVLLEENGNSINISGGNMPYVIKELIDLMMEDFERDYKLYKESSGLYEIPAINAMLMLYLEKQKNKIKEIVDEEDLKKVLGINKK